MDYSKSRLYYGWIIVAVSFLTIFLALGARFSFGVYYIAILREYGWGRAETAGAFSLAMLCHALFAPVTGTLVDRLGPRWLFPLGAIFLSAGLMAAGKITTIWHLYLCFGVFMAIGINSMSYAPHMSIIPRWFITKRGLASGLVLSGMGLGSLIIVPFNELMIENIGWRYALLVFSLITLFILVPVNVIFHRPSPESMGQYPDGIPPGPGRKTARPTLAAADKIQPSTENKDWTLKEVVRVPAFWFILLSAACDSFGINMLVVHQAAHVVDLGYSEFLAASLVGMVGVIGSAGGILCGFLSDRTGRAMAYTLGGVLSFAGILFLMIVKDSTSAWMLYAFAVLFGLGNGGRSPIAATITSDLFPGNSLGRIMAVESMGFGIAGSIGAYAGGFFYDLTGSYFIPFLLLLAGICAGVFAIWMAAPHHEVEFLKKHRS